MLDINKKWTVICFSLILIIGLKGCNLTEGSIEELNSANIAKHINILNSEDLAGRRIGTEGNDLTLEYIEEQFKTIGIAPALAGEYRLPFETVVPILEHPVEFQVYSDKGIMVKSFRQGLDFSVAADNYSMGGSFRGKLVHLTRQEDILKTDDSFQDLAVLVDYNDKAIRYNGYNEAKIDDRIYMEKAEVIIYRNAGELDKQNYNIGDKDKWMPDRGLIKLGVSEEAYNELISFSKLGYELSISSQLSFKELNTYNVMGVLPGKSKLYEDYIMLATSLDGLGRDAEGEIIGYEYDNTSSLALLIELARSLKEAEEPPASTIIFAAFNGSQIGYKGVKNYLTKPIYPQERTRVIFLEGLTASNSHLELSTFEAPKSTRKRSLRLLNEVSEAAVDKSILKVDNSNLKGEYSIFRANGIIAMQISKGELQEIGGIILNFINRYGRTTALLELKTIISSFRWLLLIYGMIVLLKSYFEKNEKYDGNHFVKRFKRLPLVSYGLFVLVISILIWLQTWFMEVEGSGLLASQATINLEQLVRMILTSIFTSSVMLFWICVYLVPVILIAGALTSPKFKLTDFKFIFITSMATAATFMYPLAQYYEGSLLVLMLGIMGFKYAHIVISLIIAMLSLLITELWRREKIKILSEPLTKLQLIAFYLIIFSLLLVLGLSPLIFSEEIIKLRASGNVARF